MASHEKQLDMSFKFRKLNISNVINTGALLRIYDHDFHMMAIGRTQQQFAALTCTLSPGQLTSRSRRRRFSPS